MKRSIHHHPEATNLPFNTSAMRDGFSAIMPGGPDPGEPGCWIVFQGDTLVMDVAKGMSFIEGELPDWTGNHDKEILIGTWKGKPVRILEINTDVEIPPGYIVEPLLLIYFHARLPDELLTLAGRAQQILAWERKSSVCSSCGSKMERISGTWGKCCTGCRYEHFPHIHPCTLVLVRRGKELLLIRKHEWPEGYYSLPSGFCDFGESLEECARREVEEETGVRIRNLLYVGSQSWPFPGQLMIGFTAEYAEGDIIVDREELEDAAWFGCDSLPPTFSAGSIAGWMMDRYGK
jgi:NAD+ diphosphatase